MKYLAVFRGRSAAIRAGRILEGSNVPARFVNTPRETGHGCGISLEIRPSYFPVAASLLRGDGFVGWWVLTDVGSGTVCTRL